MEFQRIADFRNAPKPTRYSSYSISYHIRSLGPMTIALSLYRKLHTSCVLLKEPNPLL